MNHFIWNFKSKHLIVICRSLSDDEAPANEHPNGAHVMFSTPVSSLKTPRNSVLKLKSTRFQLPSSEEKARKNSSILCTTRYINVSEPFWNNFNGNPILCIKCMIDHSGTSYVTNKLSSNGRWNTKSETNTISHTKIHQTQSGGV